MVFMRALLLRLCTLVPLFLLLPCGIAMAASGPQTAWSVFSLPNPQVTPNWRSYAPADCSSTPDACAGDNRFWEEWDFTNFQSAIDSSFSSLNSQGKYQGVMLILPLGDTTLYWNNLQVMYNSASSHGVQLQIALFPKWKFGAEYCYLYNTNAPSGCQLASGTTALAYQKLTSLMDFAQNLAGICTTNTYHLQVAVWYGWSNFSPGYTVLKNFWQSLPTKGATSACNLRSSYLTWLDTGFSGTPEVQRLQRYVVRKLNQPYWVNTELYSTAQIQQYETTYSPYQTIITGFWGASDITTWAQGMCAQWTTALTPARLGVWTFYDRDVSPIEEYRAYINGSMAVVGSICTY